jgi:cyclopropane fatty-acyl-phospholipid synthase-like methyltransferase
MRVQGPRTRRTCYTFAAEGIAADNQQKRIVMEPLQRFITDRYGNRGLPVTLVFPDGARVPLSAQPAVDIVARTWKGLRALSKPAMGSLAKAYVSGDIDFTGSAQRILGIAESMVGAIEHGRDKLRTRVAQFVHQKRSNRDNIAHHYDVSNAFYRMWLDERMVYSCAYFHDAGETLEAAQVNKLDHICRKLRLAPGERYLDIGCGWGALLLHAAEKYGVEAHGITHYAVRADRLGSGIGDFVEDYVFPGGELTHVANVIQGMAQQGLECVDAEALREHYARTLWHWVDRLETNADAARREVGEERFRVWRIYMAGSAHAFDRGWLSLWQILAGKPFADGSLPHPLTREYMYRAP